MRKLIILLIMTIFLISTTIATSLVRELPSVVNSGETFIVTYQTTNASNEMWFVGWEENITGGCIPPSYRDIMFSATGGDKTMTKTFTTPSSGSCIFSGYYQFASDTQPTNFPTTSIIIIGNCIPNWQCSAWSSCINNQQTRTCADSNNCNNLTGKPIESQLCTCTESWTCTSWSSCKNDEKTRTCNDLNSCGTSISKPSESQSCTSTSHHHHTTSTTSEEIDTTQILLEQTSKTQEVPQIPQTIYLNQPSQSGITGAVVGADYSIVYWVLVIFFVFILVLIFIILVLKIGKK